ncbi:uncharacterized protein LOC120426040 [Culex pipiens pallens]|uniref:uncharacterized protein LOC120426040 n=1 Tax=Culex pipiens pallens TaxID=42434 RepID=UPI001953538A|nr:uncharacterized protein LOC120426040 [Culex pipiens pallens]
MDIFQNQCSESLGFDSMLASNPINSPLQSTDSLNFSSSPYYSSIPLVNGSGGGIYVTSTDQPLSTGPNDVVLPSIFVKVPMQINQQYQQQNQQQETSSPSSSSRTGSQEVIKCEDKLGICKREVGDLRALEKGTAMVQLPGSAQSYMGEERVGSEADQGVSEELSLFCCELCPFVTVVEQNLMDHRQARHPNGERDAIEWMNCPACGNKFRQRRSMETHLLEDHMMASSEVQLLVDRRFPGGSSDGGNGVPQVSQVVTSASETQPMQVAPEQSKSRIYIKNVQLLKKPDVIEQENVQQETDQQQQGRKIFIRNVSLLQNANFMQNSVDFSSPSGLHESKYSFVVPAPSPTSESPPITESSTTPQRSKIFIRNVDILRNPLIPIPLPPVIASTCEMSRASSSESLYTTPPPPQVISPATSISSLGPPTVTMGSSGLNMLIMPSGSNSSTPPTTCTPPTNMSVSSGPTDYSQNQSGQFAPPRKSKIFIKNISVLKAPTIHLKSVDELNLMTIDQLQLQNLLPPLNGNSSTQGLDGIVGLEGDHDQQQQQQLQHQSMDEDFEGLLDVETPSELVDHFEDDGGGGQQYQDMQGCETVACAGVDGNESGGIQQDVYQQPFDNDFIIIEPGTSSTEELHYEGSADHMRLPLQPTEMLDHHHISGHHHQLQPALPPPSLPLEQPPPSICPTTTAQYNTGQTDEDILFVCAEEIINLDPTPSIPHIPQQQQHEFQQQLELQEPAQQGRIYVSDNLMEPQPPAPSTSCVPVTPAPPPPSPTTPTPIDTPPLSKLEQIASEAPDVSESQQQQQQQDKDGRARSRGRPKGAKQTGITKLKKLYTNLTPLEEGYKCDLVDCGVRFRQQETLAYHKRCHYEGGGDGGTAQTDVGTRCPECGSLEFRNWNTLHTHLWREHSIDMELYACHLCNFKTPVLCRLNNTHMKIHSDVKNFVCAVCDKRFKNNKQLRNHRRSHRDQQQQVPRPPAPPREPTPERTSGTTPVKCVKCGLKFPNQKSLKSHVELQHFQEAATSTATTGANDAGPRLRCSLCSMIFKTRYLLQSHVAKHSDEKRFSCEHCDYSTNDHNAIRRHKMRHNTSGQKYRCSYCDYTSIQSTTYRKHLERMHADVASALLYKCSRCAFVSISEVKYQLHVRNAKHETDAEQQQAPQPPEESQERHCESVNSDVVIVEGGGGERADLLVEEQPPLDAFSLIAVGSDGQQVLHPMIRPAGFAHNLSKVDNFYGYATAGMDYQPQQAQGSEQQQLAIVTEGTMGYGEG